jgi:hypothetical protein
VRLRLCVGYAFVSMVAYVVCVCVCVSVRASSFVCICVCDWMIRDVRHVRSLGSNGQECLYG